jgi:hypothetical protein
MPSVESERCRGVFDNAFRLNEWRMTIVQHFERLIANRREVSEAA